MNPHSDDSSMKIQKRETKMRVERGEMNVSHIVISATSVQTTVMLFSDKETELSNRFLLLLPR